MTENNAAQPGLTDEEIIKHLEDAGVSFMWVQGKSPLHTTTGSQKVADIVAGIRALLSKLRAEGVQAGGFPAYINDDSQPLQYRLGWNNCLSDCRAALASAPVAGGAKPVAMTWDDALSIARGCTDYGGGYRGDAQKYEAYQDGIQTVITALTHADRTDSQTRALLAMGEPQQQDAKDAEGYKDGKAYAAPQASEAVDLSAVSDIALEDEMRKRGAWVAPQASEAVRWVVTDDMRAAVRFAPSSAHWSERLKEFFGPDAREGINALEKQLREARADLDRQKHASEAVRNEALYLLREARALLPAFATAEAIGAWSEKVRKFGAGEVIDIPPQADKDGGDCAKGAGEALAPVFQFLLGEGPLRGVHFGERAPGAVGKWWWRQDLRAALSPTPSVVKQSLTATQTGEKGESDAG